MGVSSSFALRYSCIFVWMRLQKPFNDAIFMACFKASFSILNCRKCCQRLGYCEDLCQILPNKKSLWKIMEWGNIAFRRCYILTIILFRTEPVNIDIINVKDCIFFVDFFLDLYENHSIDHYFGLQIKWLLYDFGNYTGCSKNVSSDFAYVSIIQQTEHRL